VKVNVYYDTAHREVIVMQEEKKKAIHPYTLRLHCRCALCVDELTGAKLLKKE
jgi:hypothetical protein